MQTLCNQCSNFVQSVSKLCDTIDTQTKTVYCTSVHKISLLYTKLVYCTGVHKTSVLYNCTLYTKLVYLFIMKGMDIDRTILRYVQGWNNVKAVRTVCKMCANCVQTGWP